MLFVLNQNLLKPTKELQWGLRVLEFLVSLPNDSLGSRHLGLRLGKVRGFYKGY